MSGAAIDAMGHRKLGSAIWADGLGLEGIEGGGAIGAAPEGAEKGGLFAVGASITSAPRQLGDADQGSCLQQPAPAVQEDEDSNDAEPGRPVEHGQGD